MRTSVQTTIRINLISLFLLIAFSLPAQTWTDPINISPNMPGLDNQPDLCIDNNGTLHCVFTHKLDQNWRKIYYSKSTDDGATWTIPEDISLNPDISLMNPHIVADTNNRLYVTYDHDTGNPGNTMVYLKTFDGGQWGESFLVSEGLNSSHHNTLLLDNNNRLYVFWTYQTSLFFYRYFEGNVWGEAICPYPDDHKWVLVSAVIAENNNIHCAGAFSDLGPPEIEQSVIYFNLDYSINQWSEKTFISPPSDTDGGIDIDLDNNDEPHIAYRQRTYFSGQYNDSTMHTFYNGNTWTTPELVVNDPYEQKIAIDPYDRVHIIDREKLETGTKLVHYQKINNMWQGYIIDEAEIIVANPDIIEKDNILYFVYYKCFSDNDCRVQFVKNDLITTTNCNNYLIDYITIYPNPFKVQTTIEFTVNKGQQINVSIYDLNGRHINTIENKGFPPGTYNYKWFGTDKHGKEVKAGLYLVRLLAGKHVTTKPVELIK